MRVGITKDWKSKWFSIRSYKDFLKEDLALRKLLATRLKNMSVDRITIERSPDVLSIVIATARPGLIIGRSGAGVEELKKQIQRLVKFGSAGSEKGGAAAKSASQRPEQTGRKTAIRLDIQEFKSPESSATIMAESMAEQIEKRTMYRRLLKQTLAKIMASPNVLGAKVTLSGRLDGKEIARVEHLEEGSLPLQTLRADIDFARATAFTTYGTVGIKVWIYKGMRF